MQPVIRAAEAELAKGVTGLAVAVVAHAEVVFSAGFGVADIDHPGPVSADTAFSAQSVTKPVVATALMRLVADGVLGLDDPVNDHLGPIQLANPWEETRPVTIRHLLTHTAGLAEWSGWQSTTSVEDEVANHLGTEVEPGTRLIYSNGGYDALGCVLAHLTATSWAEAVTDLVLRPLGMSASAIGAPPAGVKDRAAGHVLSGFDGSTMRVIAPPWPYEPPPPSGSLMSTATDLDRFLIAHLGGGGPILPAGVVADMHRVHARLGPGGGGMGLGFRVDRRGGRGFVCHGGDGVGFTTFIGGYPDEGSGVVVLINTGGAQEARSAVVRAALDAPGEHHTVARDIRSPVPREVPPGVVGRYRSTYWGIRVELSPTDKGLALTATSGAVVSGATTSHLAPAGERWIGAGGMFDGWELDLAIGPDGRARLYGGVYPFEFVQDDTPIIGLPSEVDEAGDPSGTWTGTAETPFGAMPIEFRVDSVAAAVIVPLLGIDELAVTGASTDRGWLTGQFVVDVPGIGALTIFIRLGLTEGQLEGILYARGDVGEFPIPTALHRVG